jgi:tetratricopeptide (TPR) repeat protein
VDIFRSNCGRAIAALERAMVIVRMSDIPILYPFVAAPLGWAYVLAGRAEEGLRRLEEAVERAEAMEFAANHPQRLVWLGRAHLLAGNRDVAKRIGLRALEEAKRLGERGHEAYALDLLGELAEKGSSPDVQAAGDYRRAALALAEALGMRRLATALTSSLPLPR